MSFTFALWTLPTATMPLCSQTGLSIHPGLGDVGKLFVDEAADLGELFSSPVVEGGSRIVGRHEVADFFNGAAKAAFPVFVDDRPGAAWVHRGEAKVAFAFTVADGVVSRIDFRAGPEILEQLRARKSDAAR